MSEFDSDPIRNAIAESTTAGAMVTNYALIATVVDEDGTASIQTITDCDHAWQVLGLLHHGLLITETLKYGPEDS